MAGPKVKRRQREVIELEPSRAVATVAYTLGTCVFSAILLAAVLYATKTWPRAWRVPGGIPRPVRLIGASLAGTFAFASFIAAIVNARRWRLARRLIRMSNDPAVVRLMPHADGFAAPKTIARFIPPLTVDFVRASKLPRPRNLRPVTPSTNIIGLPPLQIAYLRLFENVARSRTFLEGAWREFGSVNMLRSAASITLAEYRQLRRTRHPEGFFITTPAAFFAAMDRRSGTPLSRGWHRFRDLGPTTVRVRDRYGSYPPRAALCHGAFWKQAVDILLTRVDLVVLDLSGLTPRNVSTRHELQRVVDRFPIERVVFLADERSDRNFLDYQIRTAWSQMDATSPNCSPVPRRVRVAITDRIVTYVQRDQRGNVTSVQRRLVASRSETRRLAASVQTTLVSHAARW